MDDNGEASWEYPHEDGAEWEKYDEGEASDNSMRQSNRFCFSNIEAQETRDPVEASIPIAEGTAATAAIAPIVTAISSVVATILTVTTLAWMTKTPAHVSLSVAIFCEKKESRGNVQSVAMTKEMIDFVYILNDDSAS